MYIYVQTGISVVVAIQALYNVHILTHVLPQSHRCNYFTCDQNLPFSELSAELKSITQECLRFRATVLQEKVSISCIKVK